MSPSGKAAGFGPAIRRFESFHPRNKQKKDKIREIKEFKFFQFTSLILFYWF